MLRAVAKSANRPQKIALIRQPYDGHDEELVYEDPCGRAQDSYEPSEVVGHRVNRRACPASTTIRDHLAYGSVMNIRCIWSMGFTRPVGGKFEVFVMPAVTLPKMPSSCAVGYGVSHW